MLRAQLRQRSEFSVQPDQQFADFEREIVFGAAPLRTAVERTRGQPGAQHAFLVAGQGAAVAQALAEEFDTHDFVKSYYKSMT